MVRCDTLKFLSYIILSLIICYSCNNEPHKESKAKRFQRLEANKYKDLFIGHENYITTNFILPVGKPEMSGYHVSRPFGYNGHLGSDFGRIGESNSDLGDPFYAIANGYVLAAENIFKSWGNTIRILHKTNTNFEYIVSMYAHCDTIYVKAGDWVKCGDCIGTIGNADGLYRPHLHIEIRSDVKIEYGVGYSNTNRGYLDPVSFIKNTKVYLKP